MMHDVKMGRRVRKSFSKVNEVLSMPDLIEVQKNSYYRFLKEDLREVFNDISPRPCGSPSVSSTRRPAK